MDDIDGLWLNCCRNPQDFLSRGALADRLEELGAERFAASIRGPEGKVFVLAAAASDPPGGDFILRLKGMSADEQLEAVSDIVRDNLHDIIESDTVNEEIAVTNASNWSIDDFDVLSSDIVEPSYSMRITFYASGSQMEDRMYSGSEIRGEATIVVLADGSLEIEVERAAVDHDEPDGPEN